MPKELGILVPSPLESNLWIFVETVHMINQSSPIFRFDDKGRYNGGFMMDMPGPTLYSLDPPQVKDSDLFERIVKDCLSMTYRQRFEQFGRSGQTQYGIDLWTPDGKYVVQCKNYLTSDKNAFKTAIKKDYRTAREQFDHMEHFIAATSLRRDEKLQIYLEGVSDEEVPIEVLFWEDFEEMLTKAPDLFRYFYPILCGHLPVKPQLDRPVWWINPYCDDSELWFDDCHPLLLDSFLLTTAGRGVIFLISDWPDAIGAALNDLADREKLPLTWKDLVLNEYATLSPEDSGTILTIRDRLDESLPLIEQCLQRRVAAKGSYQLIFNFCVSPWQRVLPKIREMAKYLRGRFLRTHFDLITTLDPFLSAADLEDEGTVRAADDFLASLAGGSFPPNKTDMVKQVHRHPEQCRALLQLAVRYKMVLPTVFSFASHSFTALCTLLDELQAGTVCDLLDCGVQSGLQPDWDRCAWEFHRRCLSGQSQWGICLSLATEQCSDAMQALICREEFPLETKYLLYLLRDASEAQMQTYLRWYEPNSPPYLAVLMCSRHSFGNLTEKLRNRRLAEQYRAILMPESFYNEDEMTASSYGALRPVL